MLLGETGISTKGKTRGAASGPLKNRQLVCVWPGIPRVHMASVKTRTKCLCFTETQERSSSQHIKPSTERQGFCNGESRTQPTSFLLPDA